MRTLKVESKNPKTILSQKLPAIKSNHQEMAKYAYSMHGTETVSH